jgi:hypothetical protein
MTIVTAGVTSIPWRRRTSTTAAGSEIACVDDVTTGTVGFTWRSAVTWDSEAGQTYRIQAGGFGRRIRPTEGCAALTHQRRPD